MATSINSLEPASLSARAHQPGLQLDKSLEESGLRSTRLGRRSVSFLNRLERCLIDACLVAPG